jgi:ATP-dependent protease ClpP protease subunit
MKHVYIKFFAQVNQASANQLMALIDQKVQQQYDKLTLLLSTPGGSVFHGLSLHNYLMGIPMEVETHNFGSVDSIGVVIYSAGKVRYSAPDARFLLHPVSAGMNGQMEAEKLEEILNGVRIDTMNIARTIAKATSKSESDIVGSIKSRTTLNPEEAKVFGLVHDIKNELFPKGAELLAINL